MGTLFNAFFFKIPSVVIGSGADADYAGRNGLVLQVALDDACRQIASLINDKSARDRMSARMEDLVDGLGRFRLAEAILKQS